MELVDRLKSAHSLFGDPLHRESWEEIERLRDAIIKIRTITNVDWVEDMDKHDTDINEIIKKALGG